MDATLKRRIQYIMDENTPALWKFPHVIACYVQELILMLSVASDPITFLCGLYYWRKLSRELTILLFYVGLSCLSDFLQMFLGIHHIQNIWISHFYIPLQYAALAAIFSSWQTVPLVRKLLLASIPLIVALACVSIWIGGSLSRFDTYSNSLSGLFILMAAVYTLFELNLGSTESITGKPAFWVCLGAIVYFGATLFLYCLANSVVLLPNDFGKSVFIINALSSMFANGLYFTAFVCSAKTPK
jgi:hypothetical protein